jgi:hypothetical protein
VQAQHTGPNTYIGVDTVRFDVANNEQVNCALKTRAPMPVKVLALDGHKYACHRPTGVSGTRDVTPVVQPDPTEPRGPGRAVIDPPRTPSGSGNPGKVVDPPRISCAGGAVRNGQCFCPPRLKAVQAGNNAWRCVSAVALDPPRKKQGAEARSKREGARAAFAKGKRR